MSVVPVILVLMCVGTLVAANQQNQPETPDPCNLWTSCKSCLAQPDCQWCSTMTITQLNASTAEPERCRSRRQLQGAEEWCPHQDIVDPPENKTQKMLSAKELLKSTSESVSPRDINIQTRHENVQVKFYIKLSNRERLQKVYLEKKTFRNSLKYTQSVADQDSKHTVHSVDVTLPASCKSDKNGSKMTVSMGAHEVSVYIRRTNCDCDCGREEEQQSPYCSGNGNLLCGGCECPVGEWKGRFCEERVCTERGDAPGQCESDKECNNVSGACQCGHCECPESETYWDTTTCTDLCSGSSGCALCYYNNKDNSIPITASVNRDGLPPTAKVCPECPGVELDNSLNNGRNCSVVDKDECELSYVISAERTLKILGRHCSEAPIVASGAGGGGSGSNLVIVGAILGGLALLAVTSVVLWRALGPHNPEAAARSPGYEHIDAKDTTGENPLYKPPISKYSNPLYQQPK